MIENRKLRLFAYYYPWYYGIDDSKWSYSQEFAPLLGLYDSSDPAIVRKHVEWAVEFGIDGFLVEWFGPNPRPGDAPVDENLRLLSDILLDYPQLKFAVFYDQVIRFGGVKKLSFFDQGRRDIFREDMRYVARSYFRHPNYLHFDGRPVVVIYVTRSAKNNYDSLLEEVRTDAETEGFPKTYLIGDEVWWSKKNSHVRTLDAVTAYNLHSSKKLREVRLGARAFARLMAQLYVKDQNRANSLGVDLFPCIGHAFNDFRGNLPLLPTRPEGQFPHYKGDMVEIMKGMEPVWRDNTYFHRTGEAMLFINSFNEWPERSGIEPTLEIESYNTFNDFINGRTLYMQPYGFEFLEAIKYGREVIERYSTFYLNKDIKENAMAQAKIFAYYYPWYEGPENRKHDTWFRHYPPALGFYKSDDPRVIRQHLKWTEEYSLDGFLVEWMGDSFPNHQFVDDNLGIMRELMPEFPEFRYAVFYDQMIRFGNLDYSDPGKREDYLKDMEKLAVENFSHPNYWFIGNQPVIVIYLTRSSTGGYGALLDESRERMARVSGYAPYIIGSEIWWSRRLDYLDYLDAITAFNLHTNSILENVDGKVRDYIDMTLVLYDVMQRRAAHNDKSMIPGIGHAYNDETVRSGLPYLPTWEEGSMPEYRQDMIYALEALARLYRRRNPIVKQHGIAPVFINSFNEWPERTAIEPSAQIESYNELIFRDENRRLRLPAPGFEYMQGIKEGKLRMNKIVQDL